MKLVDTGSFPIAEIEIGPRLRGVDPDHATGIAALIKQGGLQHPIEIVKLGNVFRLVSGAHRLAAYKLLGLADIPARVMEPETDQPEVEIEFDEVVENVGRRELSALDRAAHLAKLRELWLKLHPERGKGGDRKSEKIKSANIAPLIDEDDGLFGLKKDVRSKIGLSARTFFAAVQLHNGLSQEARAALQGTRYADNAAQLAQLAKVPSDKQMKVIALLLPQAGEENPRAAKVNDALAILDMRPKPAKTTPEGEALKLHKLWLSSSNPGKAAFLLAIQREGVVVDDTQVRISFKHKPVLSGRT